MLDCEQVANADCEYPLDPNQISPQQGWFIWDIITQVLSFSIRFVIIRKKSQIWKGFVRVNGNRNMAEIMIWSGRKIYFTETDNNFGGIMSIRFLLIQGIGFWGTILFFLSYQFRSNKSLFRVQFFSYLCYTVHLLLLGAVTGGISYIHWIPCVHSAWEAKMIFWKEDGCAACFVYCRWQRWSLPGPDGGRCFRLWLILRQR